MAGTDLEETRKIREASEVLYVFESGFIYRERRRGEWIPITEKQYSRARKIVEELGRKISPYDKKETLLGDKEFILDGCVIKFIVPNQLQAPHHTCLIDVFSETSFNIRDLAERLDLPLPR